MERSRCLSRLRHRWSGRHQALDLVLLRRREAGRGAVVTAAREDAGAVPVPLTVWLLHAAAVVILVAAVAR